MLTAAPSSLGLVALAADSANAELPRSHHGKLRSPPAAELHSGPASRLIERGRPYVLTDVQRLLRQGRKTDAAALMQSWLDGRPAVDGPYCDAVALWYGADLYEEALATFERYPERRQRPPLRVLGRGSSAGTGEGTRGSGDARRGEGFYPDGPPRAGRPERSVAPPPCDGASASRVPSPSTSRDRDRRRRLHSTLGWARSACSLDRLTLARLEVREVRRRHERFDQHVLHVEFPGGVVMIDVSRRRPDFRASAHLAKEFEEHLELQRT